MDKGKFGRSYQQDFTDEVFIINKVFTNLPRARYQLVDLNGQIILGNAIDEELTKFTPTPPSNATATMTPAASTL